MTQGPKNEQTKGLKIYRGCQQTASNICLLLNKYESYANPRAQKSLDCIFLSCSFSS